MGFDAMTLHRLARRARMAGLPLLPSLLRRINFYLHSSYIPVETEIGEGTTFGYGGIGCVFHRRARIGRYCLISQQVTIGGRSGIRGAPVIGDFVRIGAGAKVLGDITVGDFAVIGANAVVVRGVPRAAVVAGVPARQIRIEAEPEAAWERDMGRPLPPRGPQTPEPTIH